MQQAVADQAFTNAKSDGDIQGMVDALIFRALERNSGSVGATSNACTSIQAVNPEIAAIQQVDNLLLKKFQYPSHALFSSIKTLLLPMRLR